jgi:phospholipase C
MKALCKTLLILPMLILLGATFAVAQTDLSQYVQHVIVVIQENRPPDNLSNAGSAPRPPSTTRKG